MRRWPSSDEVFDCSAGTRDLVGHDRRPCAGRWAGVEEHERRRLQRGRNVDDPVEHRGVHRGVDLPVEQGADELPSRSGSLFVLASRSM